VVPVGLLLAYGALRLSTSLFTELRELIFAKATEGTARSIALQVFRHLHALSLRFHLERQTGGMTRDIERGTRAVHLADLVLALQHRAHADRGGAGADGCWP
jgi:ATP-binding cassette, subfamily B, heavy metal transporter